MITLAHGGGGRTGNELIRQEILSRFGRGPLAELPDGAVLPDGIVFSTDSFVITPRFFPGGDIGKLAVCGTVNDICMAGGIPRYLSLGMILEEGFSREELGRILDSVRDTAGQCGVQIVTGDTKVVPRGAADGIYLNTSGIGARVPAERLELGRHRIQEGDAVLVSGTIGEHGMAILAARHNIGGPGVASDCMCVSAQFNSALECAGKNIKFMRDPTRGGVGGILQEIIEDTVFGIELDETLLPYSNGAKAVSGMLGIDLLFSACEGRIVMIVDSEYADAVLNGWRTLPGSAEAARIGTVTAQAGKVVLRGEYGGRRLMIQPENDQLPRIC
jgi:hydrogenase expression/formation protein HypE